MKTPHKIIFWLVGATLLVALGVTVSFWTFWQIAENSAVRKYTNALLDGANGFLSELKDAETSERGYLLTGDEAFLEPYLRVHDRIFGDLNKLRQSTLDSAAQKYLDAMTPLTTAKLLHMAQAIALRRNHDMTDALEFMRTGQGKRLMDSIHIEMGSFIQREEDLLAQREAEFEASMRQLFSIIVAISLFTLLIVIAFSYWIYRESQQRIRNLVHLETRHLLEQQEEMNQQLQQINDTLQTSEEKLAVTLNSIGDAVISTDARGRVSLMNPLAEKLTGWMRTEAIGRPVETIFHIINQKTRLPAIVPIINTLAHGTTQGLANHAILLARDGGECDIADSCAPIRDRNGQITGAVLVFRDVTGEYAIQQALHNAQLYTRSLIESNIDALMTTDPGGIISDVNQQMVLLTGHAREELIGTPFKNYFTDPQRAEAGIKQVLSENKVTDYELTARTLGGKETVVSYNAATFYDGDGKLQGVFAAARDITEHKRLQQVLLDKNTELERTQAVAEKANLAKSYFLSSMSHELRTPLNAILGFAQLLEAGSPPPTAAQNARLQQITKAGWYLLELINEILDLALIESGKQTLLLEKVSLIEVLRECSSMIEAQAQTHGIRINFLPFDESWLVRADRTRLKQVLINLLTNAIKYNRAHGTVEVKCTSTAEHIRINIKDSGAGISAEMQQHLFQPFNRLGQEGGAVEGTGIGLVVSKKLVELMGGSIGVKSMLGVGSEFRFELPRDTMPQPSAENTKAEKIEMPVQKNPVPRTLLYVEDNLANLMLVEQIITRHPYLRMLSARDGSAGIALARTHLPDVILMDINLPGIGGIEVLNILRADPATAHIPVVALSANAMPQDIKQGLQAGFSHYLTKPIRLNEFMSTLNDALKFSATPINNNNENGHTK